MSDVRLRWMAFGAVILACSVTYFIGKKDGATNQLLAQNKLVIGVSDSVTKSVTLVADSARKHAAVLDSARDVIRTLVKVKHDSVVVRDTVYVLPEVAQLIQADDSLIAAQKHSLALQDTLIKSLFASRLLRDERIELLESRGTSRFSRGFQVGVGLCQTQTRAPCIYAGYGLQIKLP